MCCSGRHGELYNASGVNIVIQHDFLYGGNLQARGLLFTQAWSLEKLALCDADDPRRNDLHFRSG